MKTCHVAYCLVPEFGLSSLAIGIDLLRIANRMAGRAVFRWSVLSKNGQPVTSSCGLSIGVDGQFTGSIDRNGHWRDPDFIFCVAAFNPERYCYPVLMRWLKHHYRRGAAVGGISSGSYLLGAAGLLDGKACTIHFEQQLILAENFPEAKVLPQLCVIDDRIYTCGATSSVYDMMLHVIEEKAGRLLALKVAEQNSLYRIRHPSEPWRRPFNLETLTANRVTTRAVRIMEQRLSDPISIEVLASQLGQSQRQLQRVFKRELGMTPASYFRRLRIQKASVLLRDSDLSITEVGFACGFQSPAHFSRLYRQELGTPPGLDRNVRRSASSIGMSAFSRRPQTVR